MKIKNLKRQKLRNNEYYNMQNIFDELYEKSKKGKIFKNELYELIIDPHNIELAFRNIKNNTGSQTKGTDGKTIKNLISKTNEEVINLVKGKLNNFQPQKVRRVEIPKPNGKTRALGIPTISDRLVQQCILQILEPICEAKFYEHSYGFRPTRGVKNALARAYTLANISKCHHVVDIDIEGFFDNINHGKLLKQIWTLGIRDKRVISIISKMLKAEIEGIGKPNKGTPQGGILSPLLANIVLNEFDHWINTQWLDFPTIHEYANSSNRHRYLRRTNLKEMFLVRYADDFKIFCKSNSDAVKIYNATKMWLKERLNLNISQEKSKIVNLKNNYSDFLGIKFKVHSKGTDKENKKYVVKSFVSDKAHTHILKTLDEKLKCIEHSSQKDTLKAISNYNAYLIGLHDYYNGATHCSVNFAKLAYSILPRIKKFKIKKKINLDALSNFIRERYGKSKQLINVCGTYLVPISYIEYKTVLNHSQNSIYTKEGREKFHEQQKAVKTENIVYLIKNPITQRSMEYNDNRISKYVAQYGKCYVTKRLLSVKEMHCHHITPTHLNGNDHYNNLVIVNEDIHRLIHASTEETILQYLNVLQLNKNDLERLNNLRIKANMKEICL